MSSQTVVAIGLVCVTVVLLFGQRIERVVAKWKDRLEIQIDTKSERDHNEDG